jgi:predicted alpha/beta superfamily hydrolase
VETLFREPTLFDRYIALSPSLWWNDSSLVHEARKHFPSTHGDRILYLSAANEPGIQDNTAFFVDAIKQHRPRCLRYDYHPRPDLEHSTIFRGEGAEGLIRAFAWRGVRCQGNNAGPRP